MEATVTLSLGNFERMREDNKKLAGEVAALKAKTTLTGAMPSSETEKTMIGLVETVRKSLILVQFLIGNYNYLFFRGWPWLALQELAQAVLKMPGATTIEQEWAADAVSFAREATVVERARAEGREKELNRVPSHVISSAKYEQMLSRLTSSEAKLPDGLIEALKKAAAEGVVVETPSSLPAGMLHQVDEVLGQHPKPEGGGQGEHD